MLDAGYVDMEAADFITWTLCFRTLKNVYIIESVCTNVSREKKLLFISIQSDLDVGKLSLATWRLKIRQAAHL